MELKINEAQRLRYESAGLWGRETLLDYWEQAVELHSPREFVVDDRGRRLTYGEVDRQAGVLAGWLCRQGIGPGDVISLQVTPRGEFVVTVIACLKLGAVVAPIGMRAGADEWVRMQKMLKSRVHICLQEYRGNDLKDFVLHKQRELQDPPLNVFIGGTPTPEEGISYETILEEPASPLPPVKRDANEVVLLLFTSGTTRGRRGVMLTHNNVISSEKIYDRSLGLTQEDIMFMPSPLCHATGFHHGIVSAILHGGKLVLQERFEAGSALEIMEREGCTYSMGATPFIYDLVRLMDEGRPKPKTLKYYICGGAPVPSSLVTHAWEAHGVLVCECYGSTESVPHILVPPEKALENLGGWSGEQMEGIEIRVVDEEHRDVKPGEIGEEASRGPNVFVGYLGDRECTDAVLDDEGWYYSGDLCYSDAEGRRIKICGRKKDIIVRGGENLNVNEINDELEGCPGVLDHAVIGMKDDRLGERVCAFVVPRPGAQVTQDSVIRYLEEKGVSKWFWPERLELIDAIPYTESGKVKKFLLQQELERRRGQENERQQ